MKKGSFSRTYFSIFHIFFLFILFLFSVSLPAFGGSGSTQYSIKGRLDRERHVIDGKEVIKFTNPLEKATDEIVLKLEANLQSEPNPYLSGVNLDNSYPGGFDPGWTKIKSIRGADGKGLSVIS